MGDAGEKMKEATHADARLTEELRSFLAANEADLVGFGPAELLRDAPEIMRPQRYLPDVRAMVSIALHVNEASCDLIARSVREKSAPASSSSIMCTSTIRVFARSIALRLRRISSSASRQNVQPPWRRKTTSVFPATEISASVSPELVITAAI